MAAARAALFGARRNRTTASDCANPSERRTFNERRHRASPQSPMRSTRFRNPTMARQHWRSAMAGDKEYTAPSCPSLQSPTRSTRSRNPRAPRPQRLEGDTAPRTPVVPFRMITMAWYDMTWHDHDDEHHSVRGPTELGERPRPTTRPSAARPSASAAAQHRVAAVPRNVAPRPTWPVFRGAIDEPSKLNTVVVFCLFLCSQCTVSAAHLVAAIHTPIAQRPRHIA